MYCIAVSFVRYGWASCPAGPLTSEAGGIRPAGEKKSSPARTLAAATRLGLCPLPRFGALLTPIRTARPRAGERAVRIAGHHQDGGPTLEQAGHHQRVPDQLGDANLLAVVPVELECAGGCQG